MKFLAVALSVWLFATHSASAQDLLGVAWDGDLLRVDPQTATATSIGSVGSINLNSLSRDPSGRFFAVNRATVDKPYLWRVDPVLGRIWQMHPVFLNNVRALAHSPAGDLYAIDSAPSVTESRLYRLDISVAPGDSAIKTFVGKIEFNLQSTLVLGAAFNANGTLFGWSTSHGLITIDTQDGTPTDVNTSLDGNNWIQSVAFASDGSLLGGYENLYSVDQTSGAIALIGGPVGFGGVRGIEFEVSGVIPYCVGSLTSEECFPVITWSGSPSASAGSGFEVGATGFCDPRPGLLFYSTVGPTAAPFGYGQRCVGAPIHRTQVQFTTGDPDERCDGTFSMDFNALIASGVDPELGAGVRVWCQYWCRDPDVPPPSSWALSDALQFDIQP